MNFNYKVFSFYYDFDFLIFIFYFPDFQAVIFSFDIVACLMLVISSCSCMYVSVFKCPKYTVFAYSFVFCSILILFW